MDWAVSETVMRLEGEIRRLLRLSYESEDNWQLWE